MAQQPSNATGLKKPVMGIPLWGWGAGGLALLVGVFYFMSQRSAPSTGTSGTQTVTPPAGAGTGYAVPVPYPTGPSTSGPTPSQTVAAQRLTVGGAPGLPNTGVWSQDVAAFLSPDEKSQGILLPYGMYDMAGSPIPGGTLGGYYPIKGPGGQQLYVLGENVKSITQSQQFGQSVGAASSISG